MQILFLVFLAAGDKSVVLLFSRCIISSRTYSSYSRENNVTGDRIFPGMYCRVIVGDKEKLPEDGCKMLGLP